MKTPCLARLNEEAETRAIQESELRVRAYDAAARAFHPFHQEPPMLSFALFAVLTAGSPDLAPGAVYDPKIPTIKASMIA